ncbi:MAG: hypothetical protein ACJAUC_002885 [Planctomycetota bacterium]
MHALERLVFGRWLLRSSPLTATGASAFLAVLVLGVAGHTRDSKHQVLRLRVVSCGNYGFVPTKARESPLRTRAPTSRLRTRNHRLLPTLRSDPRSRREGPFGAQSPIRPRLGAWTIRRHQFNDLQRVGQGWHRRRRLRNGFDDRLLGGHRGPLGSRLVPCSYRFQRQSAIEPNASLIPRLQI